MDIHQALIADHVRIRQLLAEVQEALQKTPKSLNEEFTRLKLELEQHLHKEDAVYYKTLDDQPQRPDRGLMHALRNDHAAVVFTLQSLAIRLSKKQDLKEWEKRLIAMRDV